MKRLIASMVVVAVLLPTLAQGQTPVLQIVQINTPDIPRYLEWAEESIPVITAANQVPTSGGVCVPSYGAEQEGDLYVYNFFADFESSMPLDLTSGVPAREIAKIAPHRTIKARDLWSSVRRSPNIDITAGDTYSMMMTVTSTDQPDMYLTQIEALEAGLHEAGHRDVNFAVAQVMTGKFRNHLSVRMVAPTPESLGAGMDTIRTATWARNTVNNLASIRKVAQQMTANCYHYVSTR